MISQVVKTGQDEDNLHLQVSDHLDGESVQTVFIAIGYCDWVIESFIISFDYGAGYEDKDRHYR